MRWRGPPLALQIMALLVGGLVVAQLVTLVLTLLLPPAPAPQYGLDDIAAVLIQAPGADATGLQRVVQAGPPDVSGPGWLVSERSRSELSRLIGVDPSRVSLAFYTPLPFAGTAATRSLAMADDGFVVPLKASAAGATPARLLLAQFTPDAPPPPPAAAPEMPPPPRGDRLDGALPRDNFPPGLFGRGGPMQPSGGLPRGGGVLLPRQDRARPLISVEPRYAGNGVVIPGDGDAAVPLLLRGGEAGSASAGQTTQSLGPAQVTAGEVAAARPEIPAPSPPGGASGALFGGVARAFPDRTMIAPQPVIPAPRIAPPLIVQSYAGQAAPTQATPRPVEPVAPPATAAPSPGVMTPPLLLAPQMPRFAPTPQAAPYETPAGPPITVTPTRRSLFGLAPAPFVEGDFVASLKLADGRWAVVQPAAEPFPNSWQRRVLLWFAIALGVVVPLGWLFARRLVKPLQSFVRAAEQLGREPSATMAPLDGPAEIGGAAHAFNLMQGRLRAFVGDRTAMVGAISHDLRTPLTRMRFRIEDVGEDEVRDGLLEEVDEMEAMISQVIEFIRDASTPGARERLDLRTLVDDVVEDARLVGGDVTIVQSTRAPVEVDVLGMRRLLDNLLENAVKYGARARIRLRTDAEDAVAEIIDDGPGLPEDEMERVFEPFYRSDAAIASDKKGSGLGLAVCRSIARAHGGDVRLVRAPDGFRAEVRLPLAYGDAPTLAL